MHWSDRPDSGLSLWVGLADTLTKVFLAKIMHIS